MMLASSGMPWVSTIPLPFVGSISASILDYIPKSLTSEGFNAFVSFVTGNAENLSVEETMLGILFMASAAFLLAIILGVIFIFLGRGDAGFMSGLLGLISVMLGNGNRRLFTRSYPWAVPAWNNRDRANNTY